MINKNNKKKDQEINKGIISINSCYTICHLCGDLLVRTFVESNNILDRLDVYVICGKCLKTLPEVIQERLKNPAVPKLF